MGAALRHGELLTPIKFGVEKICDKTELTDASTGLKTTQPRPKFSLRRALLLGVTTVLMPLSFVQTAHAQETTPISVGQMLVPGGVQLPLGITAEAEVFYVGTGIMAAGDARHGETGMNPLNAGGVLTTGDTGFAESLFPLGTVQDATGILADGQQFVDNGTATDYADALGFKITFSQPMPISYFYGLDIDAARDEWQTAFGYDDSGNFFGPDFSTQPGGDELTVRTGINPAGWGLSLPSGGIELVYKSGNNNGITPATQENQILYDFKDEPLKEIYFLFGLERQSTTSSASNANASALSALFVPNPEMDLTKTATVGALQADNTFDITYDLLIENTGGVAFESFSLTDDLAAASNLGSVFNNITPAGVTFTPVVSAGGSNFPAPNPAYDGNGASGNAELIDQADTVLLQPGDSFTLTFTANVDAGTNAVSLPNSATASAQPVGFTGSTLVENSDDDTDETNGDNPTLITAPVAALPELTITKTASTIGALHADGSFSQAFIIELENTGNITIDNPTLTDDLETLFGDGFSQSHSDATSGGIEVAPSVTYTAAATPVATPPGANSGFNGDGNINLLDGTGSLAPGDKVEVTFTARLDEGELSAPDANIVTANGTPAAGTLSFVGEDETGSATTDGTAGALIDLSGFTPQIPDNPTESCSWNWHYWNSGGPDDNPDGGNRRLDPSLRVFDVDDDWYTTNIPPNTSFPLADNVSPPENTVTDGIWERAYGVGYFSMTPDADVTIDLTDSGFFDGHAIAFFDSSGNQFARFPSANGTYIGSTTQASHVNGFAVRKRASWTDTVTVTVPSDGDVYIHYIWADEDTRADFIIQNACDFTFNVELEAAKTVTMFDTSGSSSYAIPGSDVIYSINVTNSGSSPTDTDTIELIDNMPPEISFWNGDIDFGGPDNFTDTTPVALEQSTGAGLTFDYNTDVRFGFGATAPADFDSCTALAPDNTYRDDVTFICFNPKGALNSSDPAPTFSLNFRARIN